MSFPKRIAILGLGLIGSSLARALSGKHPELHIAAFDISHEALDYGIEHTFVHSGHDQAAKAVDDADIVVLASPIETFSSLITEIAPYLKKGAIITDTGSVKRNAIKAITPHLPEYVYYVPAHPIAGSERQGTTAGKRGLFSAKRVILTPDEPNLMSDPVERIKKLWESTGAHIEYMPADLHDRIYAYVSHLPQLIAFSAMDSMKGLPHAQDEVILKFMRLMRSSPILWSDIILANADYIGEALKDFSSFASQMEGELSDMPATGDADTLAAAALFPHVVATCLIATASLLQETIGIHPARYAGSGFVDMTAAARISDPEATLTAISSHHQVMARMLRVMLTKLARIQELIGENDKEALIKAVTA